MKSDTPRPANPILAASRFVRLLLAMQPARTMLSLAMTLVNGLLGGCTILLLFPLLELIGTGPASGRPGIARWLATAFDTVGLQPSLEVIVIGFLLLVGLQTLLLRQLTLTNARLQFELGQALQDRMFASVTRCRWDFFIRTRSSDFTHALTRDLNRVSSGTFNLLNLASSSVLVAVHLILSMLISPWLSLVVVAASALLIPLLLRLNRLASQTGEQFSHRSREFYHRIEQQLAGMKEIKSLGVEARQIELCQELTESIKTSQMQFRRANANSAVVFSFGSAILLCGLLLTAVNIFQIAAVELLVLVVIFARLAPRFHQVHSQYQQLLHTLSAFESGTQMQAKCDAAQEPVAATSQAESQKDWRPSAVTRSRYEPWQSPPTIELHDVSFCYDRDKPVWALRDVNLRIPANQTTALVGPSGAGKSTLADLLLGLLLPTEGQITIDGVALELGHLGRWRSRIGYVPQETFLLHDTIRANLLLARPDATDMDLQRALQAAAADGFVNQLPLRMDTVIGDRGIRLSGGERQRIALARALLREPAVLILDEATSNLDSENQNRILAAIQRMHGQLTVVMIAHRLSTVRHADHVVVLDQGVVVEAGAYDQLERIQDSVFQSYLREDALVS